ncbi:hypothetical protein ES702_00327 [subsurface metagenome]
MINEEKYKNEVQEFLSISNKKSDVLFDKKLIGAFYEAVNKFGFKKTWDIFMRLQDYLMIDVYQSTTPQEITEPNPKKVLGLINKEFGGKHGYSKKELLESLRRLQMKLIEEHEKLNSEKLKGCIEENIQK